MGVKLKKIGVCCDCGGCVHVIEADRCATCRDAIGKMSSLAENRRRAWQSFNGMSVSAVMDIPDRREGKRKRTRGKRPAWSDQS